MRIDDGVATSREGHRPRLISRMPRPEHFNKRSALLDQFRSRLFEIVGVLFAHNCLSRPSLGRPLGATIAYHVVDKLMIVPKSVVCQFEFSDRSRMDRLWGIVGGLEKVCL